MSEVSVGTIEPMVFSSRRASAVVEAVNKIEAMDAFLAWLPHVQISRLDKLRFVDPELVDRLIAVRNAMR